MPSIAFHCHPLPSCLFFCIFLCFLCVFENCSRWSKCPVQTASECPAGAYQVKPGPTIVLPECQHIFPAKVNAFCVEPLHSTAFGLAFLSPICLFSLQVANSIFRITHITLSEVLHVGALGNFPLQGERLRESLTSAMSPNVTIRIPKPSMRRLGDNAKHGQRPRRVSSLGRTTETQVMLSSHFLGYLQSPLQLPKNNPLYTHSNFLTISDRWYVRLIVCHDLEAGVYGVRFFKDSTNHGRSHSKQHSAFQHRSLQFAGRGVDVRGALWSVLGLELS